MKSLVLVLVSILFVMPIHAASFCANTSAEIQQALDTAEVNGEEDTINIAVGTYHIPSGVGFVFNPTSVGDDYDLTIIGGWTPFFGNPCAFLNSPNPINTTLDGDQLDRVLSILPNNNTNITIENISFINGQNLLGDGAGLEVMPNNTSNYQGEIVIENNSFINNQAQFAAAIRLIGHTIRMKNNLFSLNHSISSSAIVLVSHDKYGIYFINNTVVNNSTDSNNGDDTGGAIIFTTGSSKSYVANNIFWGNEFSDLRFITTQIIYLYNNDFEKRVIGTTEQTFASGNLSESPGFETNSDYRLSQESGLINMGLMPPVFPSPFFHLNWSLPGFDLEGNSRVQGGVVDIGVFEITDVIYMNGFE